MGSGVLLAVLVPMSEYSPSLRPLMAMDGEQRRVKDDEGAVAISFLSFP